MAHTPGPWDWHGPYMTGGYKVSALHPEGGISLQVYITADGQTEEPNAKLIAAAPDLLAALQTLMAAAEADGWPPGWGLVADSARAAIARAKQGE